MFKHYRFVDYATQGYLAIVAVLVLVFHNHTVPEWPWLVAGHTTGLCLVHLLIQHHARGAAGKVVEFVRWFYPVMLYTAFYRETGALNLMFVPDYVDPFFVRLEQRIFGTQPSVTFMEWLPYRWVGEVFYLAYFSYYVMIVGTGIALFVRSRPQFQHYVAVVSFTFYMCYLLYIFLPVMGPRVFLREIEGYRLPEELQALAGDTTFPVAVQQGVMYQVMGFIYRNFEAPGAAFPSSHVALALTTVYFSFRYLRPIRYPHAVMAFLLCAATVYCRYHYVVDVVAGVLTASLLVPLGNRLYWRFSGAAERPPAEKGTPPALRA